MISELFAVIENEMQRNDLSEFYSKNKQRLYGIAFSKLKNPTNAEDAVQETFLRITKYPKKFFEIEDNKRLSYAAVIIRNVISQMAEPPNVRFEELTDNIVDDTASIEELAIGKIGSKMLKDFILKMPQGQKAVLQLKITYGLTNAMMADVLGISEQAVRKRVSDAYIRIRNYLKGESGNE